MTDCCVGDALDRAGRGDQGRRVCPQGKPTVLIVDDEPKSLDLLQRTLRGSYEVLKAGDGPHGLQCLALQSVAAVIADQRMPGMNGVEFLSRTHRCFPLTQRILLTGFTEVEGLIEAINSGQVFGYLAKPWHPGDLLAMLRRAVDTYRLLCEKERLLEHLQGKNRELERLLEETGRLQEQKRQAEQWATLGRLAGMVAHDLRNPLAAIRCHAGLLEEPSPPAPGLQACTRAITRQVERMNSYIDELLLFSRPKEPEGSRKPYPVGALLASLEEAFSGRCREKNLRFQTRVSYAGPVLVDPSRIYRALENLVQNAVDAAREGGQVLVAVQREKDRLIRIRVADDGPGVPPEIRDRVFEPFVSRNKARGTGLGLAIVKKIAEEHGGRIWVDSGELGGACFHLLLPRAPGQPDGADTEEEEPGLSSV